MVKLRRIGVRSAGRFGFWFGVAASLSQIIIALIILFFVYGVPPTAIPLDAWLRVASSIFIGGLATAFSMTVFSFIYNWSANSFGGLELDFEMPSAPVEKRKNGDFEDDDEDD